ncbi:MAG: elongation factor P [Chloroflexi bacterium]|nr:elongation factor P [Chloroflexota bacterium]
MVLGFSDLKNGMTIELDGEPYKVEEFTHTKMQQRAPTVRIRLRNLRTGKMVERSFSGYKLQLTPAQVETRAAQYLYNDGEHYHFMDTENFEQYPLSLEQLGDAVNYLTEQGEVELLFFKEAPIALELPTTVDLAVVETAPGFKGDTASGSTKPAKVETGIMVQVPFFVNTGEKIRVDTRTGQYVERVG